MACYKKCHPKFPCPIYYKGKYHAIWVPYPDPYGRQITPCYAQDKSTCSHSTTHHWVNGVPINANMVHLMNNCLASLSGWIIFNGTHLVFDKIPDFTHWGFFWSFSFSINFFNKIFSFEYFTSWCFNFE